MTTDLQFNGPKVSCESERDRTDEEPSTQLSQRTDGEGYNKWVENCKIMMGQSNL